MDISSAFREALASFPSGVTVVTTLSETGAPTGFTASSFTSLSLEPPLVLVCLAASAECHDVFTTTAGYVVNVLGTDGADIASQFARREVNKFAEIAHHAGRNGFPVLNNAIAVLECTVVERYPGGDHTILIGHVDHAVRRQGEPLVYGHRQFHRLTPLSSET